MALSICNVNTNNKKKDISKYEDNSIPVACFEDDMEKMSVPLHWHDEYEFIYVTKGKTWVNLNTQEICLTKGESVFINSGCLHGIKSVKNEESVLRSLVIQPRFIGGVPEGIISQNIVIPLGQASAPEYIILRDNQASILENMMKAWEAITTEPYDFENESRYLISKALRLLVDSFPENKHLNKNKTSTLNRVKIALSYIDEAYMKDIGNQELIELCSCSESALLRAFKEVTGISPTQYLINYRIQKATELLLTTDMKSIEISLACGFKDLSYFTKIFKLRIGYTPLEYRNLK